MAQYRKQDLLSYSQMKTLLDENAFPDEKATYVATSLLKYCIIAKDKLYLLDYDCMVYKLYASDEKKIVKKKLRPLCLF